MIPTIYIPICDSNLGILSLYTTLFEKYWGSSYNVVILGFSPPKIELPKNFKFVSLAKEQVGGAESWSKYLRDYFSSINDELVIFSLEDFLPVAAPYYGTMRSIVELLKRDSSIGRFDLTWDLFANCQYHQVGQLNGVPVISVPKSVYRVSCQPAIWRRDFLLRILERTTNPWNFEVHGSLVSLEYGDKVFGIGDATFRGFPTRWTPKGAISRHHPGKINVLGLSIDTIRELVTKGLLTESEMQWGQWDGYVPSFHDAGGYNFNISRMPRHPASPSNWLEWKETYQ